MLQLTRHLVAYCFLVPTIAIGQTTTAAQPSPVAPNPAPVVPAASTPATGTTAPSPQTASTTTVAAPTAPAPPKVAPTTTSAELPASSGSAPTTQVPVEPPTTQALATPVVAATAPAAVEPTTPPPEAPAEKSVIEKAKEHFFDHVNVRGYTQFRYNQLGATNSKLVNLQGDKSVGQDAGILIRRARLVFSGDVHPHVAIYLQTDFAGSAGDVIHIPQIRDWYFDIAIDEAKEFRFRLGQSKIPYGFENMQSSQNRLPMDRSDALNSGAAGERDLGVMFYWAPAEIRKRLKMLTESGLKGSGDYGVVGLGVYEGQTINQPDANTNKHVVGRVSYPIQIGEQFLEPGVSGYTGMFVVKTDPGVTAPDDVRDARIALSFTLYPKPFGLQAEYTLGDGPELTNAATVADEGVETFTGQVRRKRLYGGYVLASYKIDNIIPYARAMMYEGGKKHERNAPSYSVRELELGVEWEIIKALEITAAYAFAERTNGKPPYELESGRLVRLQAQINY